MQADKILVLHHGALGDLLCAWPTLLALAAAFPGARRYALLRSDHQFFVRPLGYLPCPGELSAAEDAFHGSDLPPAAENVRLFRFCLGRLPQHIPPGSHCFTALSATAMPVSHSLLAQLSALGLVAPGMAECLARFRACFGEWEGQTSRLAGIFPGSGHRAKNWPLERFAHIARALARAGYQAVQILGPAEQERKLRLPDVPVIQPHDLAELTHLLTGMRFVFGNDSGPLHLASWLGVPCVVLFGPSDARRWGPPGARLVCSPLPCAPCTDDMRRLGCTDAACMAGIETEQVWAELQKLADMT